jgi:hypothetical protein
MRKRDESRIPGSGIRTPRNLFASYSPLLEIVTQIMYPPSPLAERGCEDGKKGGRTRPFTSGCGEKAKGEKKVLPPTRIL